MLPTKVFSGKNYVHLSCNNYLTKTEAKRRAAIYRKKGFMARVVAMTGPHPKWGWHTIYLRTEKYGLNYSKSNSGYHPVTYEVKQPDGLNIYGWQYRK